MRARSFAFTCTALALSACAPEPHAPAAASSSDSVEPSAALPKTALRDDEGRAGLASRGVTSRIASGPRPRAVRARPFDYGALPIQKKTGPDPVRPAPPATLRVIESGLQIAPPPDTIAQALLQGVLRPSALSAAAPRSTAPSCLVEQIAWETITLSTWTDASLDFAHFEGRMSASCQATGNETLRSRAVAVVPSAVYAFRECVGECRAGEEEMLVLLGPPSGWAVSSAPWPSAQLQRQTGRFSHVRVPLKRGGSATAAITVDFATLGSFVALHRKLAASGDATLASTRAVSFEIEAIWPTDDPAPSGMVVTSSSAPNAEELLRAMEIAP